MALYFLLVMLLDQSKTKLVPPELATVVAMGRVLLQLVPLDNIEGDTVRSGVWSATAHPGFLSAKSHEGGCTRQAADGQR
jgi:hypothetical protein